MTDKDIILFEFSDLQVLKRGDRFIVRYDAGTHQIAMREDEISATEATGAMVGKAEALQMLSSLQKRLEGKGINPYIKNIVK